VSVELAPFLKAKERKRQSNLALQGAAESRCWICCRRLVGRFLAAAGRWAPRDWRFQNEKELRHSAKQSPNVVRRARSVDTISGMLRVTRLTSRHSTLLIRIFSHC